MANLNADLRSYLSGSNKETSNESSGFTATGKKTLDSVTSWWSGSARQSKNEEESETMLTSSGDAGGKPAEEDGNGWFNQAQKDPFCPTLSKRQRILGFMTCLAAGAFCFVLASVYAPFIVVKARKFALLYTMGSLFTISSFSLLWGPWYHIKHLFSSQRLPFTIVYFTTMFLTLYFAMAKQATIPTAVCAICQVVALFWYIVSYIPGGQTGLKFFSKLCKAAASKTLSSALPV
ncbi:protein transport protein SFT2-like [Asterias rubens]|uniref:protein transport protein SFT2-like n=1 Tax=Asterias rubens TaxID=7604 RepID=UPI001455D8A1|nr:protein transport protein SFT2-like [Asterias rubens]XP_033642210.1 protein transport protein SFT2-like [Asterias rubens]